MAPYKLIVGLLSYAIGQHVQDTTRSAKLARTYHQSAAASYRASGALGLGEYLEHGYKVPALAIDTRPVSENFPAAGSPSQSSHGRSSSQEISNMSDGLGALTLFRSSLALTAEKDPAKLLCTLLKILCQVSLSQVHS